MVKGETKYIIRRIRVAPASTPKYAVRYSGGGGGKPNQQSGPNKNPFRNSTGGAPRVGHPLPKQII